MKPQYVIVSALTGFVGGAAAVFLTGLGPPAPQDATSKPTGGSGPSHSTASSEVRAMRFVLVNSAGRNLACLEDGGAGPALTLYGEKFLTRFTSRFVAIGNENGGTAMLHSHGIYLYDNDVSRSLLGNPRATLTLDDQWMPRLALSDEKQQRAVLGVAELADTKTGTQIKTAPSTLMLFDNAGKVLWAAPGR